MRIQGWKLDTWKELQQNNYLSFPFQEIIFRVHLFIQLLKIKLKEF
jgi:hypothetical protein